MPTRPIATLLLALAALIGLAHATTTTAATTHPALAQPANGVPFQSGDVFAAVGNGRINHYRPDGTLVDTLDTGSGSATERGMCFEPATGDLFTTNFSAGLMTRFNNLGNIKTHPWGGPFSLHPTSCGFDAAGNHYTGEADGSNRIRKWSPNGSQLGLWQPATTLAGVAWLAVAADQCTILYTSDSNAVKRYNVCTSSQLPDLSTTLPPRCSALQVLPGSGDVLVACGGEVNRVAPNGTVVQVYPKDAQETSALYALVRDPDGQTFWTAGFGTGNIYRYRMDSGALVSRFSAPPLADGLIGLAVADQSAAFTPTPTGTPAPCPTCPTATRTTTSLPTATPTPTATGCDQWRSGPDFPEGVYQARGIYFPPNGRFYVFGGRQAGNGTGLRHLIEYDPTSHTWTIKAATFPTGAVNNMVAGVVRMGGTDFVALVGGNFDGSTATTPDVRLYNPLTDVLVTLSGDAWPGWTGGNGLPGGAAVVNNKLYVLGGYKIQNSATDEIWEYDPNGPTGIRWTLRGHLPEALGFIPLTAINNVIYTAGGSTWNSTVGFQDTTDSFRFDPQTNAITAIASIPRATAETPAVVRDGRMWVLGGGRTGIPDLSTEVDIYDPVTAAWTLGPPLPGPPNVSLVADSDGTNIYLVGGYYPVTRLSIYQAGVCGTPTLTPPPPTATFTATAVPPSATPTITRTPSPTATASPCSACPTATTTATPTATATVACGPAWRIVASPNSDIGRNYLADVAVVTAHDIWAVGYYSTGDNYIQHTLIEHWDGSAWAVVLSPDLGSTSNGLYSVAAIATDDVWAVGSYANRGQTLIEHWNGSAWAVVPSPNPGTGYNTLYGIFARAADDVWAVGGDDNGTQQVTLIEHWNGSTWAVVPSPNGGPTGSGNILYNVTMITANDGWAVGSDAHGSYYTLTEHWDGTTWTVVPSPNIGTDNNELVGVVGGAANDVWAVGSLHNTGYQTLAEHWDGSLWTVEPSSNPGGDTGYNFFSDVARDSTGGLWAVGYYVKPNSGTGYQTLTEYWNGGAWAIVPSPNVPLELNRLYGVAVVAPGEIWAVGSYSYEPTQTLTMRYSDPCGTPSPTVTAIAPPTGTATVTSTATRTATRTATATIAAPATATSSGATPTRTPVAGSPSATLTGTATATPCAVHFSDVTDPAAYYYQGVYYLACRGVISGYSDGTFQPFNLTTRAQMTKIVTLAFALPPVTPPAAGTFADVDADNVFYGLIETAAAHSIVSGYTCGGRNPQTGRAEPCDAVRRPYFRPANPVTRGQLAKIVVGGAGWALQHPATPTFSDVPPGNVFYGPIETAVCHAILSGYSDGTFQPNSYAFRGQIAKIVYLARTNAAATCPGAPRSHGDRGQSSNCIDSGDLLCYSIHQ